jgi:hypothetical protein
MTTVASPAYPFGYDGIRCTHIGPLGYPQRAYKWYREISYVSLERSRL